MSIVQTLSDQLRQINMDIAYAQYKDRIWECKNDYLAGWVLWYRIIGSGRWSQECV